MKIPRIPKTHDERVLKGLNYAVKNQKGFSNHLRAKCGAQVLDEFVNSGFIQTGECKQGYEIYKITTNGNNHYKNVYGQLNYYKARLTGFFEKIMGKI